VNLNSDRDMSFAADAEMQFLDRFLFAVYLTIAVGMCHWQVTGGAGFIGSHLVDALMLMGHEVTVVDNFFTGRKRNVEHWIGHENFELITHDIVTPLHLESRY